MATYQLQIVTQEKVAFDGEVVSTVVPGAEGYLGVLAHHAPLLAALSDSGGDLTIRTADKTLTGRIEGGFIEVQNNVATILADRVEGDFIQ